MTIILETGRLRFRDHEPEDVDDFCAMEADPEGRRYVGGQPRTREQAEAKFYGTYLQPVPDRMALWATVYKPEERYIGYCGIYPHFSKEGQKIPGEGILAYYLARPYWGQGLATEAGRAFLRFGFEDLGLNRILATTDTRHAVSTHILEKLGFQHSETEVGEKRSFYGFVLTKSNWQEG